MVVEVVVDEETDEKVVDKVDEEVVVETMELRRLGKIFMQLSKNKFYYKQTFSSIFQGFAKFALKQEYIQHRKD